jgi:two-component system phosphate regulon sensor histidine kinase PhoR
MRRHSFLLKLFLGNLLLAVLVLLLGALLRDALPWALLTGVLAAAGLAALIRHIWYAPLRQIARAAGQIASGSVGQKVRISGSGELAHLASAINQMRDSLSGHMELINTQRDDVQRVLANLGEGIIALDGEGRIALMNPASSELLGIQADSAIGSYLQSVVRVAGVVDLYNQACATRVPARRQIELERPGGRRHLEVQATRLEHDAPGGIVGLLVIRDIGDLVRAADMKAEFAANASHELRTPLATLRAAADSLADVGPGDEQALEKLRDILDRHLARLEAMTSDLLDLHVVESGKILLRTEVIGFEELAHWARANFAGPAQAKGVEFQVHVPEQAGSIRSDRKLLELILRNLLDNAIKFTSSGGSASCRIEPADGGMTLTVADTGCGIAPEDQHRVFQRFFQSDAARSGDSRTRGTGLGLAIVKHAAERLGGRIRLQSCTGQGTTVTLSLPQIK